MPHDLTNFGVNANFRVAPNVLGSNPQLRNASKQPIQTDSEKESVGTTSVLYDLMAIKWPLIEDLWGGTSTMRAAERLWLPIEPKEEEQMYRNRLSRSILFNAFRATIDRLVSKPFSHAVSISEISGPDKLLAIENDVDGTGKNLTQFSRELFESGLKYGLSHILVDFTKISDDVETKEDEDFIGTRPFFIHIEPTQLIFWDIQEHPVTKVPTLNEIRIRELTVEKVGKFSNKLIETIRVFKEDSWEVWTFDIESKIYEKTDNGTNSLGIVPLVTFYVRRTVALTGTPPFEDLAWLNLAHWQSYSDQRNILRFARTGILFGAGFHDDEFSGVAWGPNTFVKATDNETKLTTVEYKGTGIKAGAEDLKTLEDQMELMGLQPFFERTVNSTATGKMIDESKTVSDIQAWVRSLENTLKNAYNLGSKWLGGEDLEGLQLDVFSDFSISSQGTKDLQSLLQMAKDKVISVRALLTEIKRRGVLSEAFDIDEELNERSPEESEHTDNINNTDHVDDG